MTGSSPTQTNPTRSLVQHVQHFQHRSIQEAVADATAAYWNRRADTFLAARPRLEDFHGNATREELRARWHRLTEAAEACRARARVSLLDDLAGEVHDVLREVA